GESSDEREDACVAGAGTGFGDRRHVLDAPADGLVIIGGSAHGSSLLFSGSLGSSASARVSPAPGVLRSGPAGGDSGAAAGVQCSVDAPAPGRAAPASSGQRSDSASVAGVPVSNVPVSPA